MSDLILCWWRNIFSHLLRESANTLEEESGFVMESPDVLRFRRLVLDGRWSETEKELSNLVSDESELRRVRTFQTCGHRQRGAEPYLQEARFLLRRQKYLELLEAQSINEALHVLRTELASVNNDDEELHSLSRFVNYVWSIHQCSHQLRSQFDHVLECRRPQKES